MTHCKAVGHECTYGYSMVYIACIVWYIEVCETRVEVYRVRASPDNVGNRSTGPVHYVYRAVRCTVAESLERGPIGSSVPGRVKPMTYKIDTRHILARCSALIG